MAALYAKVNVDEVSKNTNNLSGSIDFSIERFSLKDANWTVRLTSDSPFVTNTGTMVTINSLNMFDSIDDRINYELSPSTPKNESIPLNIIVSNGIWEYTENINLIFKGNTTVCPSPDFLNFTNSTDTSAAFEWQNTADTNYKLRYKIVETPTWTEINSISNNAITINELIDNTEYEIQVANSCSDFSTSLVFKTEDSITLNINDFKEDETAISRFYPNPVKETLTIELITKDINPKYKIFNTTGKLIQTGILKPNGTIDVSLLSSELYFLIINTMNNTVKIKFIKN